MVNIRRMNLKIWVLLDSEKEEELKNRIEYSTKIRFSHPKSQTSALGGAL